MFFRATVSGGTIKHADIGPDSTDNVFSVVELEHGAHYLTFLQLVTFQLLDVRIGESEH
jgi:hypothetical protein